MIVHYFDILGVSRHPPKTDAPLVVARTCISLGNLRLDCPCQTRSVFKKAKNFRHARAATPRHFKKTTQINTAYLYFLVATLRCRESNDVRL